MYDIRMAAADQQAEGSYLLILEPKKRRARKRVEAVHFWLDAYTYLPMKVDYLGKNGSERSIRFHEISLNPDLSASLYTVEIPADVEVTTGFSGLPGVDPDTASN
jgi:outer membrane lipoprotein-sorting protein